MHIPAAIAVSGRGDALEHRGERLSVRLFLAVPVAEPARGEVQTLLRTLQDRYGGVRWIRGDTPHLTVHFFGSIDEGDASRALEAVTPAVQTWQPFSCTLDRLGSFPPHRAPQVLWLGTEQPLGALVELARQCRERLVAAGFAVERRPYRPHCTLGRVRASWDRDTVSRWQSEVVRPITFIAAAMTLYESRTAPDGALHLPRTTLHLGPARHARHGA